MTKRKVTRKANPVAKDLRTPKYRMRVVKSKKAYTRKRDIEIVKIETELNYGS
jgi:hypothetical protein